MRVAAMAAMLAVAHGTALAGDRDHVRGNGATRGLGDSASGNGTGGTAGAGLYRGWSLQPDGSWRWGGGNDSGGASRAGGCGCAPDRSGGHAGAAGF
jgi:hypothetical protein